MVIAIIGVLTALLFPAVTSIQLSASKTTSFSNMRQLGAGLLTYAGQNDGLIPGEGEAAPTWVSSTLPAYATAWYNVIPKTIEAKALSDFATKPAGFYDKGSLFFVPAAKYPSTKLTKPLFAVSMNSKLHDSTIVPNDNTVRMANFQDPSRTVIFQEAGLPSETVLPGQSASNYDGQSKSYASRTVARYNGETLMLMADGHVESYAGKDVVAANGKSFEPQSLGKVYWTMDPSLDASQ